MSQEITVARAWCEEHLADCFFAYDESTGENTHIGMADEFYAYLAEMKESGFQTSQRNNVWHLYRRAAAPLTGPAQLDWLMAMEAKIEQADFQEQDW